MRLWRLSIQRGFRFWPARDPLAWVAPQYLSLDATVIMLENIDGRVFAGTEAGTLWELHVTCGLMWAWRLKR